MTLGAKTMPRTPFIIHPDHRVEVATLDGKHTLIGDSVEFSSQREFENIARHWPGQRFIGIWNQLPTVKKVTRFTDRKTAIRRIWIALQELKPSGSRSVLSNFDGNSTKAERVIALLKDASGASLSAIMELTGWQSHSVRGFISAQLSKRLGFQVLSFKRNGERIYRIRH
jgi:hypothetical protein